MRRAAEIRLQAQVTVVCFTNRWAHVSFDEVLEHCAVPGQPLTAARKAADELHLNFLVANLGLPNDLCLKNGVTSGPAATPAQELRELPEHGARRRVWEEEHGKKRKRGGINKDYHTYWRTPRGKEKIKLVTQAAGMHAAVRYHVAALAAPVAILTAITETERESVPYIYYCIPVLLSSGFRRYW